MEESERVRVLVVDDSSVMRSLLRGWIRASTTAEIIEAANGLQALETLASEQVDLLISDVNMPILDGTEMLSLIRSDPNRADLEVIVCSSVTSEEKVRDMIALGVSDYLVKPFTQQQAVPRLKAAVARTLEKRRHRAEGPDGGAPRVIVADPDPNFCDFAQSVLAAHFSVETACTTAEALVKAVRWEPNIMLLSPKLPGQNFQFLVDKIQRISKSASIIFYQLIESSAEPPLSPNISGTVLRSFVPDALLAELSDTLIGGAPVRGAFAYTPSFESEVISAQRQILGMMTGVEPKQVPEPGAKPAFDCFGEIDLTSESGDFVLQLQLHCATPLAKSWLQLMLGRDKSRVDAESETGAIGEILNVVAGRIENSALQRNVEVHLGLPRTSAQAPGPPPDLLNEKRLYFSWQEEHLFMLALLLTQGGPGSASAPQEAPALLEERLR